MYDFKLLQQVTHQVKMTLIAVSGMFIISLISSILTASTVSNNLGMIILVAGVCLCIFIWGIYGAPVLNYYYFLKDITAGRSRHIKGIVKKIGESPVYKDSKLYFYEVLIDEDGEERLLLIDANTPKDIVKENERYLFCIHENYIKNVQH